MYEGHLPQSGIQAHSAGELFPCFIVIYGDGTSQWINPEKQFASARMRNQHQAIDNCRYWMAEGYRSRSWIVRMMRRRYHNYCRGIREPLVVEAV